MTRGVVPVLHVITNDAVLVAPSFVDRAMAILAALGPRGALHLRAQHLGARVVFELAVTLSPHARASGAVLVINDRVDTALASGASGAQLTSRSMAVADARRLAPSIFLGASVHAASDAREASRAGADWCVAGHVHETSSHPGEPPRGAGFIAEVAAASTVPVIAIGGVLPAHVPAMIEAGAWGVAVIRGIWDSDHPERAALDYLSAYDARA